MFCGGGFLWLDVAGGGVGVVGVAACCSGVVDFPTTYWHLHGKLVKVIKFSSEHSIGEK